MSSDFRFSDYLTRIGHDGALQPDLATLTALHRAHVDKIPFEGLDPLLGRPVELDAASIQDKLLDRGRGGYCFEQNALFKAALETIGFKVTGLGARVRWMAPPESPLGPKTHMLLKVDLADGPYLADVGFGACLLDSPLRLITDVEQRTAMGTYRLTEADGLFALSARRAADWRTMYVFDLQPQLQSDYELGSWFTATSPLAPFSRMLIMERLAGDRRYKLVNRRLIVETADGEVDSERLIESSDDLRQVLGEHFGMQPPAPVDEIFGKING